MARFILVVNVVSHLILQVYMGPTGKEKLYHISMTPDNGPHAGRHAILRNKMKNKQCYHNDKLEIDNARCILVLGDCIVNQYNSNIRKYLLNTV